MIKLLTIKSELEHAKSLGFETELYSDASRVEKYDSDVVVRWGSSRRFYGRDLRKREFKQVINPAKAIRLNCNKLEALQKLATVVRTPTIYLGQVPAGAKVVYRPTEHTGGAGFSVRVGPFDVENGFYATEFVETEKEFRVWFCGNETFCCRRVALTEEDAKLQYRSNWGYKYIRTPTNLGIQTLQAAKAIGLDVGAGDIVSRDGIYFFLELNSGASADTVRVRKFYREALIKLSAEKFPELEQSAEE